MQNDWKNSGTRDLNPRHDVRSQLPTVVNNLVLVVNIRVRRRYTVYNVLTCSRINNLLVFKQFDFV